MEETQTSDMDEQRYLRLRAWNLWASALHAVSGAFMLFLSTDFTLPVTTAFVQYDPATNQLAPQIETAFTLQIGPLVAAFLFLSALAHFLIAVPAFRWYAANLKKGANYGRWMEYAFSSSLMIVVISMLVGLTDIATLLLIFFLNMMMILFGWMMELHNQTTERTNWIAYWFGVLAGAVPWVAIAIYLIGAGGEGGEVPAFVYWIYVSIFLFFNVFAVNMVLQYKKVGKWQDYLYGEKTYIILSFVAKSLLAWQVWAGTLRPV